MLFPSPAPLTNSVIHSLEISDSPILLPNGLRHYIRLTLGLRVILTQDIERRR
jgi:hypothetical protein